MDDEETDMDMGSRIVSGRGEGMKSKSTELNLVKQIINKRRERERKRVLGVNRRRINVRGGGLPLLGVGIGR